MKITEKEWSDIESFWERLFSCLCWRPLHLPSSLFLILDLAETKREEFERCRLFCLFLCFFLRVPSLILSLSFITSLFLCFILRVLIASLYFIISLFLSSCKSYFNRLIFLFIMRGFYTVF